MPSTATQQVTQTVARAVGATPAQRQARAAVYQAQAQQVRAQAETQARRIEARAVPGGAGASGWIGAAMVVGAILLLRANHTPTITPVSVAPSTQCRATYTVQSGDTLSRIAAQYGVSVTQLVAANQSVYPSIRSNPNLIEPGWQFCIP